MKVYIVAYHYYDDYEMFGIFDDILLAEAEKNKHDKGYFKNSVYITEVELNVPLV